MNTALTVFVALACVLASQAKDAPETLASFKNLPGTSKKDGHDPVKQIYNGNIATRTQFPFQAALYMDLRVFCGGSLINEQWVLTAAHCISSADIFYIFLGVTEPMQPHQEGRQAFVTRAGYKHPNYSLKNHTSDVGVILLPRKVNLNQYIQTIALTPANKLYIGYKATLSGFGKTDENPGSQVSAVLRYTTTPVVDKQVCSDAYGSATGDHPSVMCVKDDTSSACLYDSGSPLTVVDSSGQVIQIGTVSFTSREDEGCTSAKPAGAANLAYLRGWIEDTTGLNFSS